jgi:pantetheine-phosphate adenylyltransferase
LREEPALTIAVYPGSFDPITNGHLDVARRAAKLFDRVIIGVYERPEKNLMFSPSERVELAKAAVVSISNIEVRPFKGLSVDFVRSLGAQAMVRGLRVSADFEYEFDMAMMNKKLAPDLEMVCLMASPEFQFLSSSLLKEVARLGGKIDGWVPAAAAVALKKKVAELNK